MYSKIFPYFWLFWKHDFGKQYVRALRELKRQEQLDWESMQNIQWLRLKRLLDHAYANVPFYRMRFQKARVHPDNITKASDLFRIPILTRKDVQSHLDEMIANTYDRSTLQRKQTGGSTGNPVVVYETETYKAIQKAVVHRARTWAGFEPGQKMAIIWGAGARDVSTMHWLSRQRLHYVVRERWLNAYSLTWSSMEEFAKMLLRWRPNYIVGYAAALYKFALFLRESGLDQIRPTAIETTAEKIFDSQRKLLEDVFQCPVYDAYGSREVPGIAFECEMHQGLHLISDNVFLELLCESRSANPGEIGEVIVTTLNNYAMPLIRYQNGDLARFSSERCLCGRPFPLLTEIVGRSNDILTTPDGRYVHGAYFNHLLFAVPGVEQFRVYQKSVNDITISIVAHSTISQEALKMVHDKVRQHFGPETTINLLLTDSLPLTAAGKHRYIISDIDPGLHSHRN